MKDDKLSTEVLIAPQLAVQRYLDELLQDATLHVDTVSELVANGVEEDIEESEADFVDELDQKSDDERKHQIQDDLVAQGIENEDDMFAAFEFAVAALENESEHVENAVIKENVLNGDVEERELSSQDLDDVVNVQEIELKAPIVEVIVDSGDKTHKELVIEQESVLQSDKTKPLPWAESRFECLLFYVGGLKMAVPLVELGGIQKANYEKVTKIFGQPDWFIGVSSINDLRIRTVDTSRWVMPNHYKGELHDSFKFIIQLDRSNWGLACEDVAEAISLEPSDVKWRSDRSKRPWLAGTVIKHMCAILDIQGFIELLDDPHNGFKANLK